jgi:hypothetical protein
MGIHPSKTEIQEKLDIIMTKMDTLQKKIDTISSSLKNKK